MQEKYTKIIAVGNEGIDYLEEIKEHLEKNADFENINVTTDVDKEFVRTLLDGVDVLYMLYDSSKNEVHNIIKAISYMAGERKIVNIGLDICLREDKEDLGVDEEIKLNKYNVDKTLKIINLISEAMDEEAFMYVDISDIKELFQSTSAVSYSVEKFDLNTDKSEVAKALFENFYKGEGDNSLKKGLLIVETNKDATQEELLYINDIIQELLELEESTNDIIFSYNIKYDREGMKIGYIRN